MKKNWKKWTGKAISAVLIAAMAAAYLPTAEATEAEAAEASAGGTTYEGELNAMTDEEYAEFGLATNSPEEFDPEDESNPLEDYETTVIPQELFVGWGDSTKNPKSGFFVADNTDEVSADAFNLNNMDNDLIGPVGELGTDASGNSRYIAASECAVDMDGDGVDEIAVQMLFTNTHTGETWSEVYLKEYKNSHWSDRGVGKNMETVKIASAGESWPSELLADRQNCVTDITSGDFDGDGKIELAYYLPGSLNCVRIFEFDSWYDTIMHEEVITHKHEKDISLEELNDDKSSFQYWADGTVPIVSLMTTKISGREDLVINVSRPSRPVNEYEYSDNSVIGIYRGGGSSGYECIYKKSLCDSSGYYKMHFCSAVDADLNGNGIEELVVGGYSQNILDYSFMVEPYEYSRRMIQVICWNEAGQNYEEVWEDPAFVEAYESFNDYSENFMVEPVALTAGKLHSDSEADQVFLEGKVFSFEGETATASSEKERLASGYFQKEYSMPLGGYNWPSAHQAIAGTFSIGKAGTEQIVVLVSDRNASDGTKVFFDIIWIWEDGNGNLTGAVTNNDYINSRPNEGDGTYMTLCALNADEDTVAVEYEGKSYGWSDPTLYCVLQSPPYWSELQYNSETYGAGEASYSISYESSTGTEKEAGISLGFYAEVSAVAGPVFCGNGAKAGGGFDLGLMAGVTAGWAEEHAVKDSVEFIVAPGEDQAIILAVPLVIYHYKVWIPEYEVTQEDVDIYNEMREQQEDLEPYPYEVGDIVPGSWEEYDVQQTLDPAFSNIPVETYNELAEEYGEERGLAPITEETLASKTIGDPSTYPSSKEELMEPGNVENLHISTNTVRTISSESGKKLSYEIETSEESSKGFNLSFDSSFYVKAVIEGKVPLIGEAETEIEGGWKLALDAGITKVETSAAGMEFSVTVCDMPAGSDDYSFSTQLAVFNNTDLPMGGGETDSVNDQGYAYCVGYIVTGVDAPPETAVDLRVFATTEHAVVLKWDTSSDRPAQSWEVFVEDPVTGQEHSLGITNNTYFVATDLDPGTTYKFAVKSYEQENGRGDASVISRWVSAVTKDSSSSAPYFTTQPQHVIVTPDDGEKHTMTAEAKLGEGMEGATLTYQWQKYDHAHLTEAGIWENIEGATGTTYELPEITSENFDEFEEQTHYRVVATQTKGSNVKSTISKVATMYINSDASEHDFYNLELGLEVSGDQIEALDGAYYIDGGGSADFTVTISPAQENGLTPMEGTIFLMYRENGEEKGVLGRGNFTNRAKECTISVNEIPTGVYEVYAVYPNAGPDGSEDNQSFYLPAQSDSLTLHSVTEYQITYHMNGGINHSANPTMLTNESPAVVLEAPTRNYYIFTGWYLDDSLTQPLADNTLNPALLTGDVDLYAGWEAVSYQINYELNGGTNSPDNPSSYTVEDTVTIKDASRDGYHFLGWYKEADFSGDPIEKINGTTAADVTLYAKWEEIEVPFDQDDETGAYLISSYEDLVTMAQRIQENPSQYATATYVQTCNITCAEQAWETPLGTEEHPFQGIYEGEDYYIIGLRPTSEVSGLFGVIGESGTVRNLSVIDFDYSSVAELAGGIAGVNKGTIVGCGSGMNITSAATIFINGEAVPIYTLNSDVNGICAGGIAGRNEGLIQNCRSNANVSGTCAGGITGENTGTIRNIYNVGTVTGTEAADSVSGGIVGKNTDDGSIQYGYSAKAVTGACAGGIAGNSENTNINDFWYLADVSAACGNQENAALNVEAKSTEEMKSQDFCDLLNETIADRQKELDLRSWTYSVTENEGYPRLTKTVVTEQTLTSAEYGITVSGKIHPGARLELVKLSDDNAEYQSIAEAVKSGSLLEGWKLALVYENGTYATWEGTLTVTLTPETQEKLKNLSVFHMNDKGAVSELETLNDGEQLIIQTKTLGSFAVVQGESGSEVIDPDDPDNPANPNKNGGSGGTQSSGKNHNVRTGDTAAPLALICILLISGAIIVLLIVQRRKRR